MIQIVNRKCKVTVTGETTSRYYQLEVEYFLINEIEKSQKTIFYLGIDQAERGKCILENIKNIWDELCKENRTLVFE